MFGEDVGESGSGDDVGEGGLWGFALRALRNPINDCSISNASLSHFLTSNPIGHTQPFLDSSGLVREMACIGVHPSILGCMKMSRS